MKMSWVAGRRAIYIPDHPRANGTGYVLLARHLMEQSLGRLLRSDEHVHHKDGDKFNDTLDNLQVMSISEHTSLHWKSGDLVRKLDYSRIEELRSQGLGYKKISKIIGSPRSSVQSACFVLERG